MSPLPLVVTLFTGKRILAAAAAIFCGLAVAATCVFADAPSSASLFIQGVQASPLGGQSADPVSQVLAKTLEYCRRLEGLSLYFVCRERVEEREYAPPLKLFSTFATSSTRHVQGKVLEYDYQLIRRGELFEEARTLLREDGRPRNLPNASLMTRVFKHKYMIFGPAGLFGEFWQDRHSYVLLGEEGSGEERALVIEARPTGPPEPNLLYGKVWVRKKDCAILKIEWDQRALGNFDKIERMAQTLGEGTRPRLSILCEYGTEKNGIRFPDRLTIREDYETPRGVLRVTETTVVYSAYKFFTVETEVRY